jgi:hypothetical protein
MEEPRRAGDIRRLPSEEGQGDLSRRWQPTWQDQPVKRFHIPLQVVPGLTSTIYVAQGTETLPIVKLDETMTPTARDDQKPAQQQMPHHDRAARQLRLYYCHGTSSSVRVFGKGSP